MLKINLTIMWQISCDIIIVAVTSGNNIKIKYHFNIFDNIYQLIDRNFHILYDVQLINVW